MRSGVRRLALFAAMLTAISVLAPHGAAISHEGPHSPIEAVATLEWHLIEMVDAAGVSTVVDDASRYTVQMTPEGDVFITADCNQGFGSYVADDNAITFSDIGTTLVLCPEGSRGDAFLNGLAGATAFSVDTEGSSDQLLLALRDGGSFRFDPSLTGVVWQWQEFEGGDGSIVAPDDPVTYTLEFDSDGSVTGQIDCNRARGAWTSEGAGITISLATTRVACPEGSLFDDFLKLVTESTSYVIRDGKFWLALPMDGGISEFAPVLP